VLFSLNPVTRFGQLRKILFLFKLFYENDAQSLAATPDDPTRLSHSVRRNDEIEAIRHAMRAGQLEQSSSTRHVAHYAFKSAPTEIDRSGLESAIASCGSMIVHVDTPERKSFST